MSRFGLTAQETDKEKKVDTALDREGVLKLVEPYSDRILRHAGQQRERYLAYLRKEKIRDNQKLAIAEPGYNGTCQYFLRMFLKGNISGYYFCANFGSSNPYGSIPDMHALYQRKNDPEAGKSALRRYEIPLENGFLTAPTGAALGIKEDGSFYYTPPRSAQVNFRNKEKMFTACKRFFSDVLSLFHDVPPDKLTADPMVIDELYGILLSPEFEIHPEIREEFTVDEYFTTSFDRKMWE
jgi:hypothetical protein